jgi:integrase
MNLFSRIRRLVSFAKDRATAVDALTQALHYLALLKPSESTVSLDPKPMEPGEFRKLLDNAEGDDRAMTLLGLNGAVYLAELVNLRWSDVRDGFIVTHRAKTGRCVRVCVLWKETQAALDKIPRPGEFIFTANHGGQLGVRGMELRFRNLRDAAGLPHITSSQMRDSAYTAAVEGNVSESLGRLLTGHRSGISDHYVKRKPSMVAPACEAIYQHYMVSKQRTAAA